MRSVCKQWVHEKGDSNSEVCLPLKVAFLCRQVYRKVCKHASRQAKMQVSGSNQVHTGLLCSVICNDS